MLFFEIFFLNIVVLIRKTSIIRENCVVIFEKVKDQV
jgi:hypothetical protein